jgi:hypothetical protein
MGVRSWYRGWQLRNVQHVEVDDGGFRVLRYRQPPSAMLWADLATVHAFKRDLYVVDMLCPAITAKDGSMVEVNEQMRGYPAFAARIDAVPGIRAAWPLEVLFPAFDPCLTLIYPAEAA